MAALFGHKKARMMVKGQGMYKEQSTMYKGAIWFHASSVGEFEQARPLIEKLRREKGQNTKIVVTFFSPSGYEARKNYNQADGIYYLPFATRRNARKWLDAVQPKTAIFVKYEFWPAYLRELKRRKIPTYSICSIFREGQLFFRPWGKWYLSLLDCFTHIYVQDEASKELLGRHGIHRVSVAGDTRFDRMNEVRTSGQKDERTRVIEDFVQGAERVIVAGSTWPKDEELLAKFLFREESLEFRGKTKLILVPHEIDEAHLHFIFNLFQGRMVKYSTVQGDNVQCTKENLRHILQQANVLVIDTMGLLSKIYPFGHVAYIGGGFGVGIHNTIEAAAWGMPVVFGPNYHHFREAKGLIAADAARSISNYTELEAAMNEALKRHTEMGAKAAAYVRSELGTTDRIYHAIFNN